MGRDFVDGFGDGEGVVACQGPRGPAGGGVGVFGVAAEGEFGGDFGGVSLGDQHAVKQGAVGELVFDGALGGRGGGAVGFEEGLDFGGIWFAGEDGEFPHAFPEGAVGALEEKDFAVVFAEKDEGGGMKFGGGGAAGFDGEFHLAAFGIGAAGVF